MKNKALRDLVALAMLSLLLTMVVLAFSTSIYRFPMFISYFVMPTVLKLPATRIFPSACNAMLRTAPPLTSG